MSKRQRATPAPSWNACTKNPEIVCSTKDRCESCGWNPSVEKMRKESKPAMRYDLCVACAEQLKEGYTLKKISGGVDNKITCSNCGRRRYGATYELAKKETKK